MLEFASGLAADDGCILAMPGAGNVMRGAAVRPGDQSAKLHGVAGNRRVTRDRSLARAIEGFEERSFASNGRRCVGMIDAREDVANAFVVRTRLDADRALRNGGKKFVGAHDVRGVLGQPEASEPGKSKKRGIDVSRVELAQSRFDIAAQWQHTQIGPLAHGDRLPAQRRGAEARAFRQLGQRRRLAADEHITRILALEACRQYQPARQHRRHILRRMHRKVDATGQQGLLDLFREQAFAALFRQSPILDDVAGRPDHDEFNPLLFDAHRAGQPCPHRARLDQGERAAARTNAQGGCGLRHITSRC